MYARALRANQNLNRTEVLVGAVCTCERGRVRVEGSIIGGVISEVGWLSLCGAFRFSIMSMPSYLDMPVFRRDIHGA